MMFAGKRFAASDRGCQEKWHVIRAHSCCAILAAATFKKHGKTNYPSKVSITYVFGKLFCCLEIFWKLFINVIFFSITFLLPILLQLDCKHFLHVGIYLAFYQ